jgi:hypothetical protein
MEGTMEDGLILKAEYIRAGNGRQFDIILKRDTLITSLAMELSECLPLDIQRERMPGDKVRVYRPDGTHMEFELVMRWQMTAR